MYSVVLMAALSTGSAAPDCCWGCGWGCGWGWACPVWVYPVYPVFPVVVVDAGNAQRRDKFTAPEPVDEAARATPRRTARVLVKAPVDAKIQVDGVVVPAEVRQRGFKTPALKPGRQYHYTFKAEVVRDGEVVTETKRVDFRAGSTVTVSFDKLSAPIQSASR